MSDFDRISSTRGVNYDLYPANPFGVTAEDVERFYSNLSKVDAYKQADDAREMRSLSRSEKQEQHVQSWAADLQALNDTGHLTLKEKDHVISVLRKANKEHLLPDLAERLNSKGTLSSLYSKMGMPAGAALFLGLLTGGLLLLPAAAEAGKQDRQPQMIKLLKAGKIDPAIIASLKD